MAKSGAGRDCRNRPAAWAMIAMMAAIGRSAEYCGLPAGNEAHRVALEVLKEHAAADGGKPQA